MCEFVCVYESVIYDQAFDERTGFRWLVEVKQWWSC